MNLKDMPSETTERVSLRLFSVKMTVLMSAGLGLNNILPLPLTRGRRSMEVYNCFIETAV